MLDQDVEIVNKLGLHARAAARFVTEAKQFVADIRVRRGERTVNGKSIMGLMMLAAAKGSVINIQIDGVDEGDAMTALVALIQRRFDEAE